MPNEPTNWDRYEISLPRAAGESAGEKPGDLPSFGPSKDGTGPSPPVVRSVGFAARRGRDLMSILIWFAIHFVLVVGGAMAAAYVYESVLYEPLWGPMPVTPAAYQEWVHRRVVMTRVAIVLGAILGGAIARILYALFGRED